MKLKSNKEKKKIESEIEEDRLRIRKDLNI